MLCALLLCFIALQTNAQQKGFLMLGDSVYSQGYVSFDHRKPTEVKFGNSRRNNLRTYTIEQDNLSGFGFMDSTCYVALAVPVQGKVQRLLVEVLGDSVLYYLQRDRAFYKAETPHEQIAEADLLPYLQAVSPDSAKWNQELHLFRLRKGPLRYFAENLQGRMPPPTVLFQNYGGFIGFNRSMLRINREISQGINRESPDAVSYNMSAGLFLEVPIWSVRNLSVLTQASYGVMKFNETTLKASSRYDYKLDLNFLRLSVMPRYTQNFRKLRFSAFAGPSVMYCLRSNNLSVEMLTEGDRVFVSTREGAPVNEPYLFGYEAGGGISFFYLPQHYLAVSLSQSKNYSRYFNLSNTSVMLSLNL